MAKEKKKKRFEELMLELLRNALERLEKIEERLRPRLTSVRIGFEAHHHHHHETRSTMGTTATPAPGPVTLTTPGQVAKAILFYFDQNGAPMPDGFVPPAATFSTDDTAGAVVKVTDNGDDTASVADVADGTAAISVDLTSAEGLAITASETVTVSNAVAAPVLTSVKIGFQV